jgi:hypothetical protein
VTEYIGWQDPWLDRAFPGLEEMVWEWDVPRCWCGGELDCGLCDGTGIALELGGEG